MRGGAGNPGSRGRPPRGQLTAAFPTARPGGQGNIKTLRDAYEFAVDVSDFSPEDIIVTTSNNQIEVRAEKVSLPAQPGPSFRRTLRAVSPPPCPCWDPRPGLQTLFLSLGGRGPPLPIHRCCPFLPRGVETPPLGAKGS